jgi:hypothetical protein
VNLAVNLETRGEITQGTLFQASPSSSLAQDPRFSNCSAGVLPVTALIKPSASGAGIPGILAADDALGLDDR